MQKDTKYWTFPNANQWENLHEQNLDDLKEHVCAAKKLVGNIKRRPDDNAPL